MFYVAPIAQILTIYFVCLTLYFFLLFMIVFFLFYILVGTGRIELPLPYENWILNPARLPVPPQGPF